jgi:PBP1b-binding outer membrane lipoprotein LpoB
MRNKYSSSIAAISTIILIFLSGCSTFKPYTNVSKKDYQIILYISSESGNYVNPVNVVVKIDQKKIVDQNIKAIYLSKHSTFRLSLTEGQHQIVVESNNGNAGLDVVFEVHKPLWLALSYWGKNHFQLNISEVRIGFL